MHSDTDYPLSGKFIKFDIIQIDEFEVISYCIIYPDGSVSTNSIAIYNTDFIGNTDRIAMWIAINDSSNELIMHNTDSYKLYTSRPALKTARQVKKQLSGTQAVMRLCVIRLDEMISNLKSNMPIGLDKNNPNDMLTDIKMATLAHLQRVVPIYEVSSQHQNVGDEIIISDGDCKLKIMVDYDIVEPIDSKCDGSTVYSTIISNTHDIAFHIAMSILNQIYSQLFHVER